MKKKLILIFAAQVGIAPEFKMFTLDELKKWANEVMRKETQDEEYDIFSGETDFDDAKGSIDEVFGDYGIDLYINFMNDISEESRNNLKNNL